MVKIYEENTMFYCSKCQCCYRIEDDVVSKCTSRYNGYQPLCKFCNRDNKLKGRGLNPDGHPLIEHIGHIKKITDYHVIVECPEVILVLDKDMFKDLPIRRYLNVRCTGYVDVEGKHIVDEVQVLSYQQKALWLQSS